jgi:orotidine-5'-phosphate decarboxylase
VSAPIAVALDAPDLATAVAWATAVGPYVSVVKVGLELYLRDGADAVEAAAEASGRPVFLDLKLHDIPNTVAGAARSVARLAPAYLTVHAAGGAAMVAAAAQALPGTKVAAVTVLTSLSAADLDRIGLLGPPLDAVRRLAVLAVAAGARALVCSPQEVAAVRAEVDDDVVLITPGVRLPATDGASASALGDQVRVATPEQALADGADLLVVGRPITAAADPAAAAAMFAERARAALPSRGPAR